MKYFFKYVLNPSIEFRVKANKLNYVLQRMPKIVYTVYDMDVKRKIVKIMSTEIAPNF